MIKRHKKRPRTTFRKSGDGTTSYMGYFSNKCRCGNCSRSFGFGF